MNFSNEDLALLREACLALSLRLRTEGLDHVASSSLVAQAARRKAARLEDLALFVESRASLQEWVESQASLQEWVAKQA